MTALNPVFTIGNQIEETLTVHGVARGRAARLRAIELLAAVSMPDPERRVRDYPHQLSGGLRQRALIAIALACSPALIIADEPTTALDVTIQAQILDLLRDLKKRLGLALLLITHDLGVVAEMADRVAVMYAGRIVEEAAVRELVQRPASIPTRVACWRRFRVARRDRGSQAIRERCHRSASCRRAARSRRAVRTGSNPAISAPPALTTARTALKRTPSRCYLYGPR